MFLRRVTSHKVWNRSVPHAGDTRSFIQVLRFPGNSVPKILEQLGRTASALRVVRQVPGRCTGSVRPSERDEA